MKVEESASRRGKRQRIQELQEKIEILDQRREVYDEIGHQIEESSDSQVSLSDPDARTVIKHRNIVEVGYTRGRSIN